MAQNCPQMVSILNDDQCLENFAGLGATAYIFLRDDIDKDQLKTLEGRPNVYSWGKDVLLEGKHLYKVELRENSQSFTGESQGQRKGFKITGQLVIEVVNEKTALLCRALNNREYGIILPDGDNYQIMYSPTKKITRDAGALKTETGASSSDDRVATLTPVLENQSYPNYWVEIATDAGIDSFDDLVEGAEVTA